MNFYLLVSEELSGDKKDQLQLSGTPGGWHSVCCECGGPRQSRVHVCALGV